MRQKLLWTSVVLGLVLFCGTAVWKRLQGYPKTVPEFASFDRAMLTADEMRPGIERLQRAKTWLESQDHGIIEIEWTIQKQPYAIDEARADLKQQLPKLEITEKKFPSLKPMQRGHMRLVFDHNRVALDEYSSLGHCRVVWDGQQAKQVFTHAATRPDSYMIMPNADHVHGYQDAYPCPIVFWWQQQMMANFDNELRLDDDRNCFSDGWLVHDNEECFIFAHGSGIRYVIGKNDQRIRGIKHGDGVRLFSNFQVVAPDVMWPMRCVEKDYRLPAGESRRTIPRVLASTSEYTTHFDFETMPTDDDFDIEFKVGGRVADARYDPLVVYDYDPDRSQAEWDVIMEKHDRDKQDQDKMTQLHEALIGKEAPDLGEGTWLNCDPRSIADFRGQSLRIGFTAVGCAPCENMLASFAAAIERGSPVQYLLVFQSGDTPEQVSAKIGKFKLKCPVFIAGPNSQGNWSGPFKSYGISAMPTTVFVDGTGKVTKHQVGMFETP